MASLIPPSIRNWRERQRARQEHERLGASGSHDDQDHDEEGADANAEASVAHPDETATLTGQRRRRSGRVTTGAVVTGDTNVGNNNGTSGAVDEQERSGNNNNGVTSLTIASGSAEETEDENGSQGSGEGANERPSSGRPTMAQLQNERVRMQQRANVCVMCAVFLLFFLWVQAIGSGDFGLLLVCLIGTNWTARFMRHQRERDEEFERFLATYDENAPPGGSGESGSTIYGHEIQTLSFQAQVALAIMESQRQMMEGGYGHPDGALGGGGVSDAAKERWTVFDYQPDKEGDKDALKKPADDELPHCSICLAEYEAGDACVRLPCQHMYHKDCVDSWTANHTRCPLCNLDLMANPNSSAE